MNNPIFKSSNARGLPGGGMLKFRVDRYITPLIIKPKTLPVQSNKTVAKLKLPQRIMRQSNRNFNIPPPPSKARAFELFKIGSFKFLPPRAKMVFKCSTLSSHFVCQMPLLKNNRRRFLSSVITLVYIRGTQRYQFKRESYFRRWLRGSRYTLRTRNTY